MALTIIVKKETGITVDNAPVRLFDHMISDSLSVNSDGFEFKIIGADDFPVVRAMIVEFAWNRSGLSVDMLGGSEKITFKLSDTEIRTAPTPPLRVPVELAIDDVTRPGEPERVTIQPISEELFRAGIRQIEVEEEEVDRENEEDEGSLDGHIVPPSSLPLTEVDRNTVSLAITSNMESKIASSAKCLDTKIIELNKLMTKIIPLKREIGELTSVINSDPIVESIMSDAQKLTEEDNLVERAFFTDSLFVIKTKRLSTDNIIDGSRRDIGQMAITVDLKCLVSSSSGSGNPVKIFNLTHQIYSDGADWQCGHAQFGTVCWGNAIEPLFEAIEKRDLFLIAEIVIRFIKNPDPQDFWGRYIKLFPAIVEG